MDAGLRIVGLKSENIKRLVAVDIRPKADVIQITGANGAGKSSVLDSIAYALGGKELIPAEPIRHGETEAEVTVDLGEMIVRRRWTTKGSYLEVTGKDGVRLGSPQSVLDKLVGTLSFDPLAFSRLSTKEQKATLLDLLGIAQQLDGWEQKRAALYAERTGVNRQLDTATARLNSIPTIPDDVPDVPVDISALLAEANAIRRENATNAGLVAEQQSIVNAGEQKAPERARIEAEIVKLRQSLELAEKTLAGIIAQHATDREAAKSAAAFILTIPAAQSTEAIERQIASAEEVNRLVAAKHARSGHENLVKSLDADSKRLTKELEAIESAKSKSLATAKWPIPGLAFAANGVTYNDVPFEQCSSAEQLRVSLAIGMALNPKLRVLLIRDGSLLDSKSFAEVEKLAGENGYQVWIEQVDESGKVGIVIEDGEVKR